MEMWAERGLVERERGSPALEARGLHEGASRRTNELDWDCEDVA